LMGAQRLLELRRNKFLYFYFTKSGFMPLFFVSIIVLLR
jgi:hypothetical protein